MIITITFTHLGRKGRNKQVVEMEVANSTNLTNMRQLWEMEQVINNLPGNDTKVKVDIKEV